MGERRLGPRAVPTEPPRSTGSRDWEAVRARLAAEPETPERWEELSWADWWLGDTGALFTSREHAYRAYLESGNPAQAARLACWLASDHADFRGEIAVARGWLATARRILDDLDERPEHGWLALHVAELSLSEGDTSAAAEGGRYAQTVGRRFGLADLEMLGLATEGLALVTEGRVADGIPKMDTAAAAILAGDFDDVAPAAWCCCYMLYACDRLRDYRRAEEWARRFDEWSARTGVVFAAELCEAHYAGVLVWRGEWAAAAPRLEAATRRLGEVRPPMAIEAIVRLADLRRRQGRLDEAREVLEPVADEPAAIVCLGEIAMDAGDVASARDRAHEYLRSTPGEASSLRAPGLDLLTRACAALGEFTEGRTAHDELAAIAGTIGTEPLLGASSLALGTLLAALQEHDAARIAFEDAVRHFRIARAPFELARARAALGSMLLALGRTASGLRELDGARAGFSTLGAMHESRRIDAVGRSDVPDPLGTLSRREREVAALLVRGLTNHQIAVRLVLSDHTVKRHVANILRKLDVPTRAAVAGLAARQPTEPSS